MRLMKKKERGFTLIETVVALTILAFVLVPLAGALVVAQAQTAARGREYEAVRVAERELELLQATRFDLLPDVAGRWDVPGERGLAYEIGIVDLSETTREVTIRVVDAITDRELVVVSTVRCQAVEIPEPE